LLMSECSPQDVYTSPLASRNASERMLRIWSPRHKFNLWRRVWLAVAESQHEVTRQWQTPLVTPEQVAALRGVVERGIIDEEIKRAAEIEREVRHDVMSHVHCLAEQCPEAKPIIHLGMTSQDVVCNADLLLIHEALELVQQKIDLAILAFGDRASAWGALPALGMTHYQPAQPTTMGRRVAGWAHDLAVWAAGMFERYEPLKLRGFRGATGTQASFLHLLGGDAALVDRFEALAAWKLRVASGLQEETDFDEYNREMRELSEPIYEAADIQMKQMARRMGGPEDDVPATDADWKAEWNERSFLSMHTFDLTGQTYPRIHDALVLGDLGAAASVLHKIATDVRLLSNRKELDEPFAGSQIGSSAMPYKRNPMRCERICGLTRFVMNLVGNGYDTAATQWLERTLDDSSNRRLSLPEAFLALDGALDLMRNVASGLIVNEAMVRRNLMAELPFLATENILMEAVKRGGDRQELHEKIRVHAQAAGARVKQEGLDNDLIERLRTDPAFEPVHHLLTEDQLLDPMQYVGRAPEQVDRFISETVEPLREQYKDELGTLGDSEPRV